MAKKKKKQKIEIMTVEMVKKEKVIEPMRIIQLVFDLYTGMTTQIHVALEYIKHPIIGDTVYGGNTQLAQRTTLYAYKIQFNHLITNGRMHITAPLPDDMASLIPGKKYG